MKYNYSSLLYPLFLLMILIFDSCEKEIQTKTALLGTVLNISDDEAIYPAFLILGDELLATTDKSGKYEISTIEPGTYSLVCSAMNYSDRTVQLDVKEGNTIVYDFLLSPDDSKGRVYGELHDQTLYNEQLTVNPSMADWNGKELFDGVSGATIQTMTFGFDLPASEIYIGDSLHALTDGFGQYWFDIQSGTYPIRVSCPGHRDTMQIVKVESDARVYANFILLME